MFFEGATIYSHGHHWPIATFFQNAEGARAVVLNCTARSVSTSHHTSAVRAALRGRTDIQVFELEWDLRRRLDIPAAVAGLLANAEECEAKARRRRMPARAEWDRERAERYRTTARDLAAFFGESGAVSIPAPAPVVISERTLRERERRQARALATAQAKNAERFAQWRAGVISHAPDGFGTDARGSAYLRVYGEEVQTSRGAEVPIAHALRMFRAIRAHVAGTRPIVPDRSAPFRVGHFTLDRIDAHGNVHVGCHYLTFERMEECARMLETAPAEVGA